MTGTKGRVIIEYDAGTIPPTEWEIKLLERTIKDFLLGLAFKKVEVFWEG